MGHEIAGCGAVPQGRRQRQPSVRDNASLIYAINEARDLLGLAQVPGGERPMVEGSRGDEMTRG